MHTYLESSFIHEPGKCFIGAKPLQAARSLVDSRHAVCFGLGGGKDHLIINKDTGEVNRMRGDGINYYQELLTIPPDKVEEFCAELNMGMSQQQEVSSSQTMPATTRLLASRLHDSRDRRPESVQQLRRRASAEASPSRMWRGGDGADGGRER